MPAGFFCLRKARCYDTRDVEEGGLSSHLRVLDAATAMILPNSTPEIELCNVL